MKKIVLMLSLCLCVFSCNQGSKQNETSEKNQDLDQTSIAEVSQEDLKTFLSKKTPLTENEFKNAFPQTINNLPIDDEVEIVNNQGYAEYGDGKLTLTIYDCAGKNYGKATLFGTVYNIKAQDIDDIKYENRERDNIKTISTYRANSNQCDIVFLYHNRWYVALNGKDMNPNSLWNAFDVSLLKNFKN